jgi:hypothetical protein
LTLWTNGVHVLRQLGLADGHEQQTNLLVGADGCMRSAAIIKQSALVGKVGQWEQPLLCSLRDGLIPLEFAMFLPRLFVANLSLPS